MLPVILIAVTVLVLLGAVVAAFAWIGAFLARRNHSSVRLWASIGGVLGFLLVAGPAVIVTAIALPSFLHLRKEANETSALASVRRIHQAEIQYNSNYPQAGYTCTLSELGGAAGTPPGPKNSQFLMDDALESGRKDGYVFRLVNCTRLRIDGKDQVTNYHITAVPELPGKTGDRGFCSDMSGQITSDPAGGSNCFGRAN